jgi:hypothetical protein
MRKRGVVMAEPQFGRTRSIKVGVRTPEGEGHGLLDWAILGIYFAS